MGFQIMVIIWKPGETRNTASLLRIQRCNRQRDACGVLSVIPMGCSVVNVQAGCLPVSFSYSILEQV